MKLSIRPRKLHLKLFGSILFNPKLCSGTGCPMIGVSFFLMVHNLGKFTYSVCFILVEQLRCHVGAHLPCFLCVYSVDSGLSDKSRHAQVDYPHIIVVTKENVVRFKINNLDVCVSQGLDLVTKLQLEKNRVLNNA